jgi:hypothetical protein
LWRTMQFPSPSLVTATFPLIVPTLSNISWKCHLWLNTLFTIV